MAIAIVKGREGRVMEDLPHLDAALLARWCDGRWPAAADRPTTSVAVSKIGEEEGVHELDFFLGKKTEMKKKNKGGPCRPK
ncbi:hypothetical protein E2562_028196 [Oryza meyeriana var. granulata]|uniref:Uncharacterized protein n=1 Tax=Oryza meyeriana var. granulata TaxID=110450 RepID=A0A6G1CU20_9ORYZ|nr:hypothetical protein E2562_028196 [Oryza meyeriana var. granulata]